jgi:hypothetical protein
MARFLISRLALVICIAACSGDAPPQAAAQGADAKTNVDALPGEHLSGGITVLRNERETVEIDESGHGAVLCTWSIYLSIQYVGKTCFPGETETQSLLAGEIDRIDRFIMENGPATREQVGQRKARILAGSAKLQCGNDDSKWLEDAFRAVKTNPAGLHAGVDDLLSVPRRPVMNPCL